MTFPGRFFKYTYIMGASGSARDRREFITVQAMIATFYVPAGWVKDAVRDKVETDYKSAFLDFGRRLYGIVEIDAEEIEEIAASEAPGFYYLITSLNDTAKARYKLTRKGLTEFPLLPKVKGGYRRILNFLRAAGGLLRGIIGF